MRKAYNLNIRKNVYYWFLALLCCMFLTACEDGGKTGTEAETREKGGEISG